MQAARYIGLTLCDTVTKNAVGLCDCLLLVICEMALEGRIRDSGVFLGYGIVWMQFLAEVDGNDVQRETNNAASMASFEDDVWILNEWLPQYTVSLYLF